MDLWTDQRSVPLDFSRPGKPADNAEIRALSDVSDLGICDAPHLVYTADKLALERRERGLKLSLPEATALLTSYLPEGARDGETATDLMGSGRNVLRRDDVMEGCRK